MSEVVKTTESGSSRWFNILVFIVSGFVAGLSIANIIYYSRVKRANGSCTVSSGEANAMIWVNVIVLVFALIIFLWSLWRLLFGHQYTKEVTQNLTNYLNAPPTGLVTPGTYKPVPVLSTQTPVVVPSQSPVVVPSTQALYVPPK